MKQKKESGLSLRALTRILGLTSQRVNQLEREGIIKKLDRGWYPITAVTAYCEFLRRSLQGSGGGQGPEKSRLLTARARKAELEVQELEGSLARLDEFETALLVLQQITKQHLLAAPTKIASRGLKCANEAELEKFARDVIYGSMRELAAYQYKPADFRESDADADDQAAA